MSQRTPDNRIRSDFGDDALWDLLGRSEAPAPGPFFVRQTVRKATASAKASAGSRAGWGRFPAWLRPALLAGACGLALTSALMLHGGRPGGDHSEGGAPQASAVSAGVAPDDFEVIKDLDVLLAQEENSLWTEEVY